MVVDVYGVVNGNRISGYQKEDGCWYINPPRNKEGQYFADLFAVDEAGNVGFYATALYVVDANCCISKFSIPSRKYKVSFKTNSKKLKVVACKCVKKKN